MLKETRWARQLEDKYPPLSADDDALLDKIQKRALHYFTEFAHPVSGMARDRSNGDNDVVVTGGTGFGIMAMIAGVSRGWLAREEFFERLSGIVHFLKHARDNNFCDPAGDRHPEYRYHGTFPHYLNGKTGAVYIFPQNKEADIEKEKIKLESGDIVETSFLMMGLLNAREYFRRNHPAPAEERLCREITELYNQVEWDRHVKDDVLYWKRHPADGALNHPIEGWNECLVTQVLAASSPAHAVSPEVYERWATSFNTHNLHCGEKQGPLFFAHYSFLGIDPRSLSDAAGNNFFDRNRNHVMAQWEFCREKYGPDCWGLTVCDGDKGYKEYYPACDEGIIAPTAALSSFPYARRQSLAAMRHFDRLDIEGAYGFYDGFKVDENHKNTGDVLWRSNSYVAIDQGPLVGMIENGRSGLLWNLFMGSPEVSDGLLKLGFFLRAEARSRTASRG